jgi:hypothetical protein
MPDCAYSCTIFMINEVWPPGRYLFLPLAPADYAQPREFPVHRDSASQNVQFGALPDERPEFSTTQPMNLRWVSIHDYPGHLRAQPDAAIGGIRSHSRMSTGSSNG